jgi:hypothetical protein
LRLSAAVQIGDTADDRIGFEIRSGSAAILSYNAEIREVTYAGKG